MDKNTKMAAAMAAVTAYISSEEAAMASTPDPRGSVWGQSGRKMIADQTRMMLQRNSLR